MRKKQESPLSDVDPYTVSPELPASPTKPWRPAGPEADTVASDSGPPLPVVSSQGATRAQIDAFHYQRTLLLWCSLLGIVATFLPWVYAPDSRRGVGHRGP